MSDEPLWTPSEERIDGSTLARFAEKVGHDPRDYDALWRWSVDDLEGFWQAVCDFFEVRFDTPPERVLGSREMPGAEWFPGARLSYAEHVFRGKDPDDVAIRHASELRDAGEWTWADLRRETGRMVAILRAHGVGEGDRVAAYVPNIPETVAAFLATATIGAIWSSAAPEFGARSVVDRFSQIEPKVLLAVDGYRYGGKDFDRREVVKSIAAEIGNVPVVEFGYLSQSGWAEQAEPAELEFAQLPFDHPLWILYSSGTTGLPKSIVHGQGGILLEHLKKMHLHLDAQEDDRVFWFSTTGWMMWNFLVGVLLTPASIVLYDGNPAGDVLWQLAADTGMTTFGTSAAFIASSMKEEIKPNEGRDLSVLDAVGSTGSPLSPRASRGSTTGSAETPGCSPPAAAPTCAPRSWAECPCCPSTGVSSRAGRWAVPSSRGTPTATRSSAKSASW